MLEVDVISLYEHVVTVFQMAWGCGPVVWQITDDDPFLILRSFSPDITKSLIYTFSSGSPTASTTGP
jgi:hypothetical protein